MKNIQILAMMSLLCSMPAMAAEINYTAVNEAGFSDVAELLKSMTPEQQAEIMRQASIKQKELAKLTPEQLEALRTQLCAVGNTIAINKVDPEKLDPSKSKSTENISKDMKSYQDKKSQGKIKNAVVKE